MLTAAQVREIRKEFPYLAEKPDAVYLDNAATTQKPQAVLDALARYYESQNGNPHRGAHHYAIVSTDAYENARVRVQKFLGARSANEIVFLRNATEALNLLAYSWGMKELRPGDEILLTLLEHHSNLLPWQQVAATTGARLVFLYPDQDGWISTEQLRSKVSERTRLFTCTAASNVLGTMPPLEEWIPLVRQLAPNVRVVVDGAQYVPHMRIDVQKLGCDFLVFSGHKMCAAMGIGVLYGREALLNAMCPFLYGGEMIEYVYEDRATYLPSPQRFEAGTVNVGGAVSLAAAIDYLEAIGMEDIAAYEAELMRQAYEGAKKLPYLDVYATSHEPRSPVLAFNYKEVHPHDVASILDNYGICVRSGHHCVQPLHRRLGMNFSCRASFAFYNTPAEVEYFLDKLKEVGRLMQLESTSDLH